jgi:hypothetical protein
MMVGFAFIGFFVAWALLPLYWFYKRWRQLRLAEIPFAIVGVIGAEFILAMVLAFMNAITYNGIFRWSFWLQ